MENLITACCPFSVFILWPALWAVGGYHVGKRGWRGAWVYFLGKVGIRHG